MIENELFRVGPLRGFPRVSRAHAGISKNREISLQGHFRQANDQTQQFFQKNPPHSYNRQVKFQLNRLNFRKVLQKQNVTVTLHSTYIFSVLIPRGGSWVWGARLQNARGPPAEVDTWEGVQCKPNHARYM